MICDCGNEMVRKSGPLEVDVRGEKVVVNGHEFLWCDHCRDWTALGSEVDEIRREANLSYIREHGLVEPSQIRELRESLGMTQPEFEKAIGAGRNTVSRWESGTVIPAGTANTLLGILIRHPELVGERLREPIGPVEMFCTVREPGPHVPRPGLFSKGDIFLTTRITPDYIEERPARAI